MLFLRTRESSDGQPKMGPRETARQQQKQNSSSQAQKRPIVAFPKVAPPKPPHKAKRFSLKSNHPLNESILRSCGSPTMEFKLTDASFKGSKIVRETFENLKVFSSVLYIYNNFKRKFLLISSI